MSTGDFDIQGGSQGENESQGSSPEISFNGGKSVIPMMKFENLKTEFENISLTGSIIVFDNNIYYANNVVNNNKELEKRPLDDLNPVTEERSLEMTQSEETKSEAKTSSLTETQQQLQEENEHIVVNRNFTQENALKKTGAMGFSFPKIQQELKISTEDFEENDETQGENEEKSSVIENSVEVSNGEIPVMKFEDFKTDFNKISLTGSMIVFDNNLYYSNNEEKKELEKQPLDDLGAVIEERSLEMTQSEEANSEAKSDSFTETEQKQEDELVINKALAQETVIILQENALEKYFKSVKPTTLPFPKLRQNLKISTEDPEDSDDQNLTQEKSSEIETSEIPVMKFENFKIDFEKISLTGSMIVFDKNLYYSKNENAKELETQPIDDSDIVIEERSLEMTQSQETASEAKGNSLTEAEQQHENELALNKSLAKENMMILQESALERYFKKTRASLEKMQSEETLSENSLSEQLAINKSLAKENMIILQESALERYFKNAQSSLEKVQSEEASSQNSLAEAEQQGEIELTLNKSLAKENMVVLQESALEKYFKNVRSSLGKTQSEEAFGENSIVETEQQLALNKSLAKENVILLQESALEKYFNNVRLSFENPRSEETESENSLSDTEQQLSLNKSLAKENMKILQENALDRYFKRMQPTHPFSKFKISDEETEQQLIINQSLAKENMRILQKTALEKYFKKTMPSFEKTQSEESNNEDSLTKSQQQQDNDLILNKSLAKENIMILQENALEKYFKNMRPSLEKTESKETYSQNSLIEAQQELAINKSLAKENMKILQGNALNRYFKRMQPTNPFEQQLILNKSLAKENMMILQENALGKYFKNVRPSLEKTKSKETLSENFLSETQQELALNESLAKENMMILQENALERYFKNAQPTTLFPKFEQQLMINKSLAKENMMILQENALEKYFKNQFSLEKTLSEGSNSDNSLAEAQQQQDEDLRLNKTLAKENVILLQKSALKKFFENTRPSFEKTQSEETYSENSLPETEDQLAVNKSLAKETMRILQENALEKYFKKARPSLEKMQSQESNSENSLIEVQQELAINRSLAKENMMILQENALEKYFKKTRFSLEKTQSEKTLSENSLTETQQQQDEDLRLNKSLAKENVILLQESALKKYFNHVKSTNLSLHKIPGLKISPKNFDLQGEQRENDSQGSTPEESLDVAKEMEKINMTNSVLVLENHSAYSNNLMNEDLEMWALGDLSPVCEERSCEIICSEANSPTTIQQQPENDLIINKTLAKETVSIIQESALKKFFDNVRPHKASESKISPINIDLQEENDSHNSTPEETPNVEKEMTKINLTSSIIIPDNPLFYSNPLKSEEFEMWALGNLSPVCEEKSCEITCSEANSPSAIRQPQDNNLTMKTLTKENVILLQENNAFKRNSKNAGSLNFPPPKTQDFTISSGDIDLQEAREHSNNTPGRLSGAGRSSVPMMKFENLKADFESISLTGSIILDNKLHPVTEERSLQSEDFREAPLTATFRNQLDNEILLFNKKLAKKNVLIIQENALTKYFNSSQPSIPETMTFRSKAIDSDRANQKSSIEDLQERKSNPKVLKPLMSFGGNEEDEEEAKSIVLPTDPSAQDPRNLSDISELESLNNSIATPKITASPLAGPKSHEADSDALKESIFLNSHSPYHGNMNTQEDRLPTFGSSILKQPTINSIMSSGPEKPLSDHNQSISGSTESHNDSPTKQSQPVKFRNSSIFKGFTMAQTLMIPPDLGFSSPMSLDKGQFNHPPTIVRHTSVPSDQDSNHKRPSKMSASTSNLFRLTPLDGTADLLEERKSIDTRGSHQRSLQYEKTKSIRRSFLHKNLLQSQFSTEEIMANNSHNKHQTGGRNRENLSNNTAKSSGEVSERFSLSDISLSMLQNEELNLSNNGDISGEIAPQEDFLKSLNFNDSLLLPGQLTRNGSLEDLQYDVSAVYNENIGRIETYKKLGNQAGCIKLLKELAHEVEKQEKEEGEESPDNQKEMINYKFYKIQIYNMLSLEYYEMKSFEEALEFTNKVIDLDRYNIQALYKSYQIHIKLKKDAEAKSILTLSLKHFQKKTSKMTSMFCFSFF